MCKDKNLKNGPKKDKKTKREIAEKNKRKGTSRLPIDGKTPESKLPKPLQGDNSNKGDD